MEAFEKGIERSVDARYTPRYTLALPMMYLQSLTVPSVLFYVVESTLDHFTVTSKDVEGQSKTLEAPGSTC
jgi:hypothetical protein